MLLTWGPGGAAPLFFGLLLCNIVIPWVTLWSRKVRTSLPALFFVSLMVNIGMYIERLLIIPVTLVEERVAFRLGYLPLANP